jgi:hypothetical protein
MDKLKILRSESQLSIPLDETDENELPAVLPALDQDKVLTSELALGQINKLPRDYRIPLVLFHLNGLSYQSIASFLEISINAAQKRVQRARRMLRKEALKMIDDVFIQHQLSSEFAYELQALFETYELAKEDESRQTDKVDGVLPQVMKLDAYGNLVTLFIMPLKNISETATKELKFGPSGVPTEYYDDQGRQLKIRTEPSGWHDDPYIIIEALEEIAPGAILGGVGVHRQTYQEVTSGNYPLLVKEDLIWNLRSANCTSNMINHTRMILPPSAVVLQCSPMPVAIWQEGDRICIYIRQYTGESAYGYQSVAFLLPAYDGSCVRDAFLLEREKSPLAREIKRLFGF